ncbi:MAG: glycosyltransferase family 4 protein [Verrucomicrobiales bacterium]|nr:glycosyltransferase family 4 protein [Verrucomicrobiales bacterium]
MAVEPQRKRRLLVISNLFAPDRGGGASVFTDLCVGLAARGWEVTVYGTHPYYPEWRRKSSDNPWRISRERYAGVTVLRHGIYVPQTPSRLIPRILCESSFGFSLLRSLLRRGSYDAVMVFCPMLSAVGFAALRKILWREPLWLNVQDIPADAAEASGISQSRWFGRLAQVVQRRLFSCAEVWSTISPVMVERLERLRGGAGPVHCCPNWLNQSMSDEVARVGPKTGRAPSRPLRLLYAGNIGKKQGLIDFLKVLAATAISFDFQIHGDGGEASVVKDWVLNSGDTRFRFGPFLDESGFVRALHTTDLFVICEKPGSGASFIPSKLIPGIATGTPILAICDRGGPLGREVETAGLGMVLEWTEIETLGERLEALSGDGPVFGEYQARCVERARIYSRDHGIANIERLLLEMTDRRDAPINRRSPGGRTSTPGSGSP